MAILKLSREQLSKLGVDAPKPDKKQPHVRVRDQAWREIGGVKKFYRSKWEANFARYLQFLQEHGNIEKWEHEPSTFYFENIKRGTTNYKPDFLITRKGVVEVIEVKGYMDAKSATKIKRFKKYYPEYPFTLIDAAWFGKNANLKHIIKGWE